MLLVTYARWSGWIGGVYTYVVASICGTVVGGAAICSRAAAAACCLLMHHARARTPSRQGRCVCWCAAQARASKSSSLISRRRSG
jgi:hypothetical protein